MCFFGRSGGVWGVMGGEPPVCALLWDSGDVPCCPGEGRRTKPRCAVADNQPGGWGEVCTPFLEGPSFVHPVAWPFWLPRGEALPARTVRRLSACGLGPEGRGGRARVFGPALPARTLICWQRCHRVCRPHWGSRVHPLPQLSEPSFCFIFLGCRDQFSTPL